MNNAVEGWHSSLRYKFSNTHLRLAKFLAELQVVCHDVDNRLKELLRGEPPKARCLTYIANDARIQTAKLLFAHFYGTYLTLPLPAAFATYDAWFDSEIWRYTAHQSHHLGVGN